MFKLFILGAGFSRPAGLPVGSELFASIAEEARHLNLYSPISEDLDRYFEYADRAKGHRLTPENVDLEQFMSFLDVEHSLRFTGGDTWSEDGNRTQLLVRYLIAKVLHARQVALSDRARQLYDTFARRLEGGDRILTFNYDTLVEDALDRVGKPYRFTPSRFSQIDGPTAKYADDAADDIVILKLHGSINWFDIRRFNTNVKHRQGIGIAEPPGDAVFNHHRVAAEPIIRGPYWPQSALQRIYRVSDVATYFAVARPPIDSMPLIVSPSYSKILYLNPLRDFWDGFDEAGSLSGTLAIVGYSLPPYDDYVLQALYAAVRNFQHYDTGDLIPKTKMRVVDLRATEREQQAYRDVYRFAEWDRVESYFGGFDAAALEMLFAA